MVGWLPSLNAAPSLTTPPSTDRPSMVTRFPQHAQGGTCERTGARKEGGAASVVVNFLR